MTMPLAFAGRRFRALAHCRLDSYLVPVILLATLAAPAAAQTVTTGGLTIRLESTGAVPSLLGAPNWLTDAGDGTDRLFVTTQGGYVQMINGGASSTFLNLGAAGVPIVSGGETGLLGLAFHPNFAAPVGTPGHGKVYTYASEQRIATPDFTHPELVPGNLGSHHDVLREWTVSDSNPNQVDTSIPSRVLLRVNQPQSNHNGGGLVFGPGNNLFLSIGDGGGSNDNFGGVNAPTDGHTNGTGNAQDVTNVFGKILRIDPLGTSSTNGQYGVPASNPFAGATAGVDEIFAYGLRNPFRISVDRANGNLWTGDVGQGQREEVDQVNLGGNYGWVYREGTRVNRSGGPAGMLPPVGEYTHSDGNAVIGGFVYRGTELAPLTGRYIFGDLAGTSGSGRLFYLDGVGQVHEFTLSTAGLGIPGQLYGFGQDRRGELYALFASGEILRLSRNPGDLNLDGLVNLVDVQTVGQNWQTAGPLGDANGDGVVNLVDVQVVGMNWTQPGGAAVPEPATWTLAIAGALAGLAVVRHQRTKRDATRPKA